MLSIKPFLSVKAFLHLGVGIFLIGNNLLGTPSVGISVDGGYYGTNYMNEHNSITITVTFTGTDANSGSNGGYGSGNVKLYYVFQENGTTPVIGTNCGCDEEVTGHTTETNCDNGAADHDNGATGHWTGGADLETYNCAKYWVGKSHTISGSTISFDAITSANINDRDQLPGDNDGHEGNHFDFKIRVTPQAVAGAPNTVYLDIDDWDNAGSAPFISYDITDNMFGENDVAINPSGSFFDDMVVMMDFLTKP